MQASRDSIGGGGGGGGGAGAGADEEASERPLSPAEAVAAGVLTKEGFLEVLRAHITQGDTHFAKVDYGSGTVQLAAGAGAGDMGNGNGRREGGGGGRQAEGKAADVLLESMQSLGLSTHDTQEILRAQVR